MPKRILIWDDLRHGTGVPVIDEQHRRLIAAINVLYDGVEIGLPHGALRHSLASVLALADRHFAVEEAIMRAHGYPDLARHESEHRALIAHASNLVNALDPARPARTALAFAYLVDWAEAHILQADKAAGAFVAARTQRPEPALADGSSALPEPPR